MSADDILARLGPRLYHVTAASNAASIKRIGLLTPDEIGHRAGLQHAELLLRKDRREVELDGYKAMLNHQLPLRAGMRSAHDWLMDCSIEDWAAQLDRRVYFLVKKPNRAFEDSVREDVDVCVCSVSTKALIERYAHVVWLSPINSGNARRRPALRGDWLYVPATASWFDFRENRRKRGLVSSPDTAIVEVSVTRSLSPDDLLAIDWREQAE